MTVLERQAPARADASPTEPPPVGSRAEVASSAAQAQAQSRAQEQAQEQEQAPEQSPARAAAPIAPAAAATVEPTVAPAFAPAVGLDERSASSRVLKVQAALLQATGFVAGQQALVAAVARHYQFDRVSLGWVRSKGVVVQAISQTVVARLATEAMAPCAAPMA